MRKIVYRQDKTSQGNIYESSKDTTRVTCIVPIHSYIQISSCYHPPQDWLQILATASAGRVVADTAISPSELGRLAVGVLAALDPVTASEFPSLPAPGSAVGTALLPAKFLLATIAATGTGALVHIGGGVKAGQRVRCAFAVVCDSLGDVEKTALGGAVIGGCDGWLCGGSGHGGSKEDEESGSELHGDATAR